MACYIRLQEGDDLVESGEFSETQVQHPPDQHSSIPRICRSKFTWVRMSRLRRGGRYGSW